MRSLANPAKSACNEAAHWACVSVDVPPSTASRAFVNALANRFWLNNTVISASTVAASLASTSPTIRIFLNAVVDASSEPSALVSVPPSHFGSVEINVYSVSATRVPAAKFRVSPVFGIAYVDAVPRLTVANVVRPASSDTVSTHPVTPTVPPAVTATAT